MQKLIIKGSLPGRNEAENAVFFPMWGEMHLTFFYNFSKRKVRCFFYMAKHEYWLTEEGLTLLSAWARDGLTDQQMASNIGIARSTFSEWKRKFREISDTLKTNKDAADYEVENALYKKAMGYNAKIQKAFKVKEVSYKDGKRVKETEKIVYAEDEVHIPADTTAQIFWLKNRQPEKWRDKRDYVPADDDNETGVILIPPVIGGDT